MRLLFFILFLISCTNPKIKIVDEEKIAKKKLYNDSLILSKFAMDSFITDYTDTNNVLVQEYNKAANNYNFDSVQSDKAVNKAIYDSLEVELKKY